MKIIFISLVFALFALTPTCQRESGQRIDSTVSVPQEYNIVTPIPMKDVLRDTEFCCNDKSSYIPDPDNLDYFGTRVIRVNFHFMYNGEGKNNVPKEIAEKRAKAVLAGANAKMRDNCRMKLPQGNNTPDLPIQLKMVLTPKPNVPGDTGVYFHDDEELYYFVKRGKNENRSRREVIKKYGVQLDTVLNIFIMPHHPDSVKSKQYKADVTGIALRSTGAIKIAGWHINPDAHSYELAKIYNHEVGHILGLNHAWTRSDGCDDTPQHPNCWHFTKNGSVCDSLISNNVMDYNSGMCAWTPCQLGKMHYNLSTEGRKVRNYLEPNFCKFDGRNNAFVSDSLHWKGAKDMRGNVTIGDGGVLTASCRVSMPESGKIIVLPGGTLILNGNRIHNACGYEWGGIKVYKNGNKVGKVILNGEPVFENTGEINFEAVRYAG